MNSIETRLRCLEAAVGMAGRNPNVLQQAREFHTFVTEGQNLVIPGAAHRDGKIVTTDTSAESGKKGQRK